MSLRCTPVVDRPNDTSDRRNAPPRSAGAWREVAYEDVLLAILQASPEQNETLAVAFTRKEHELAAMFDRLTVIDAMELHRRLSLNSAGDKLASWFRRLVVERRGRLLSYLADARRREALRRVG